MLGVCASCANVDGDYSTKEVTGCSPCGAFLCEACRGNYVKRLKASLIEHTPTLQIIASWST